MADEIALSGVISKYTNVLFGYQKRYFKLRKGTLSYFLSKEVQAEGCRKFRALKNFELDLDDDDECRLDLVWPDERWFLRFSTHDELELWRNALEAFVGDDAPTKAEIIATEQRRHSVRSLPAREAADGTPPPRRHSRLEPSTSQQDEADPRPKRRVLHTTTTIVEHSPLPCARASSSSTSGSSHLDLHKLSSLRTQLPQQFALVQEVLEKVVQTGGAPMDLAVVEQTCDRCKQLADGLRYVQSVLPSIQVVNAEDARDCFLLQESMLSDDEWHDATSEGPLNEDAVELKQTIQAAVPAKMPNSTAATHAQSAEDAEAPIFGEIRRITDEQLHYAMAGVEEGEWELFVKDGEMRMYKMEKEVDGVMVDPLKATNSVKGVTAREFIDIFFDPALKQEWDDTLVRAAVVDRLAADTVVLHQLHKRVWPAAQRESLFWSTRRSIPRNVLDADAHDGFIVCNHDCEREDVPLTDPSCVRVGLTIAMVAQTVLEDPEKPVEQLGRADVKCKITYVAQVHPGGWLPTSALRAVYKKEYPKFLRKFSAYVQTKVKGKAMRL
ncbi:Collagen type IV alpha-3-binding protein [Aphelenchoides fujianensis]|nr:Collagen type IV alpha-3-binding protein [Aphelenchoides fujianensis]